MHTNDHLDKLRMKHLSQLRALLADAKRQLGFMEFSRGDALPLQVDKHAATAGDFSLRELQVAMRMAGATGNQSGASDLTITERQAGELIPLSGAIIERSRVAQAGAQVVLVDPAKEARPIGDGKGTLGFAYQRKQFITVDPAPFALVAEPAAPDLPEVGESDLPVSRIFVGFNGSTNETFAGPSYGVRFKLPRAMRKEVGEDQLLHEVLVSIVFGLARAADHAFLSAVVAAAPAAFSLAAAAARGVQFKELRALVGTAGTAAAVGQDGVLRAAGVPAELTPTVAPTIVGCFGNAGVAVHDSLRIAIERLDAAGNLVVTCWADMQALLPDDSFFWTAA